MKIERLNLSRLPAVNVRNWLADSRIASPMSQFEDYADRRSSWMGLQDRLVVELTTDTGLTGYGQCRAATAVEPIIKDHLWKLVQGRDPRDFAVLNTQLRAASLPYGRGGLAGSALSAIDIAIWDLRCKVYQEPLYQLLGGKVRDSVPIYVTTNFAETITEAKPTCVKLAMPYGPTDGHTGLTKNAELIRHTSEHLGCTVAMDCFAAWTVPYTIELIQSLRGVSIAWLEDPLPPADLKGYRRLRQALPHVPIALGNFEFSSETLNQIIDDRLIDIAQPDITWVGGITAAVAIMTRAEEAGIYFSPHNAAEQPWAVQLMATTNLPAMAEYVVRHAEAGVPSELLRRGITVTQEAGTTPERASATTSSTSHNMGQ